jgi:aryl-alcohol dehydrogenase-like predicted oxidoreductase
MRYIKLGRTGLDVSPIAIGGMTYGEPGRGHPVWSLPEDESRPLIRQAVEAGINVFDTANLYSQGSSEEILGRALRDFADRDAVVIATKVRHPMRPGPNGAGLSRKAILTEIDHSLRRLGTDYVDLYQIHRMDNSTPVEETLEALHDVVQSGKARYLGASSMHAWEFATVLNLQRQHGWARFVSMQDHYNLLAREEEREMLPLCADEGIGTIPWSPLARGRLARGWDEATGRSGQDPFRRHALHREGQRPRDHRRGRGDRRGPRRDPGPGRAGLAAPPAGRRRAAGRREQAVSPGRRPGLAGHPADQR